MYWVNFFHIYQPHDQSKEILKRVANESYRPLFNGLLKIPGIKINLNINAALTELLVKEGYQDVVASIKRLAETNRLEFTESAKYHPLLPFLEKEDAIRQIKKNRKDNKKYFGKSYQPSCLFPPEMAYSPSVAKLASGIGYKMIILDEISFGGGRSMPPRDKLLTIKGTKGLIAVFRERRVSNCIMSAIVRNKKDFRDILKEKINDNEYLCTAMDGETFGHHRPGLEKFLFDVLESNEPKQIFLSELPALFEVREEVSPVRSTWASSQEDIEKGIQFYSWRDPKNKVHKLQWEFLNYLTRTSKKTKPSEVIQEKIDRAMASDSFFWASGEPWWSIEMIEKGAWAILQTLKCLPRISEYQIKKGEQYYKEILSTAFWWQRSGKIENLAQRYKDQTRIPFKERTVGEGKPEVYYAFLDMMKKNMYEAAKQRNYEKAILWRDAVWKLETKNDIYDAIHAVDMLRMEVSDNKLRSLMDRYKEKYKKIQPGQPELRKAS